MQFINVIYTKSTNISFNNFLVDEYHLIMWVSKPSTISNQQRLFRIMLGKDDIPPRWNNIWFFLLFEDKGRLHAHHNRIKRGLLLGQSLSRELEWDCRQQESSWEFRYSWLGLFNYWIGHNYPVPSSPPHAPRSGTHWPNRIDYFTLSPLETNLHWLFNKQSVLQCCSLFFFWTVIWYFSRALHFKVAPQHFILRRLRNISFWDGSATFHYLSIIWDSYWNGCNCTGTF